jgi:CubicO group peptidase (beta-lactamase class C family)
VRNNPRSRGLQLAAVAVVACVSSLFGVAPEPAVAAAPAVADGAPSPDPGAAAVIARYQARIPQLMAEQDIPGLSVAVVDGDHFLWAQGFGYTDRDRATPIDVDTIFSVQSMSKLFTATAVMRAFQAGLVDLDVPITTYLPDFTVHSAFEEHPERKITLRMLLSHTAGFTHEAPIGNNFAIDPGEFDAHVRSISDTWLRFPVGTGYAYSNLGIDLAGYILEKVYGRPFASVMNDLVLAPVGMDHSTFDRERIRATADRAIGHAMGMGAPLVDVPMTAAGGLYASASDLVRFLRFELGDGTIGGQTVLDPALVEEQRTVPAPNAGALMGYALGVERTRWRVGRFQDLFCHGGGGFGFLSDLFWLPKVQLGIAILTNSADHDLQGDLALSILHDLVTEPGSALQIRLLSLPSQTDVVDISDSYQAPAGMSEILDGLAMPDSPDQAARWSTYAGAYRVTSWGVINPADPPDRFAVDDGVPYFESSDDGSVGRFRLTEFAPGMFISDEGETLDFTGTHATWRNLELIPVNGGPLPWQWALLSVVALVALAWFAGGLIGLARRRRGGPKRPVPAGRNWRRLMAGLGTATAVVVLLTVALIGVIPGLADSGFVGQLSLPLALKLILHLPLTVALAAAGMVAITIAAWARGEWQPRAQLRYVSLTAAAAVLAIQLAAWSLVGWGFS